MLTNVRHSRVQATSLRLTVGGRIDNAGIITHYVAQSATPLLAAASPMEQSASTPVMAHVEITAKEIINSGTIAAPHGMLTMTAKELIKQQGAAIALDAVQLETPGHLFFGEGSVTGVHGKTSLDERPAVYAIAASISGAGGVIGDLNPEVARFSKMQATTGTIDLSSQAVESTHSKRLWNGRKKTRKTVKQIPFVFRGPVELSGPENILLTAVHFNAQPHQSSTIHARQKIVLQGAKGSIYTSKSRFGGRASTFQEYLVPSIVDHTFNVRSDINSIVLYGFLPFHQLSLEAVRGTIRWSAVPVHSRIRSTGLGIGIDVSALAGTLQSSMDLTPWLLGERRLPKLAMFFSIPLQSYIKQLGNSEQPDWAKLLNTYGAYKDAHAFLKDMQQWRKSLTTVKVGGRLSYTSYHAESIDYAASLIPPLASLRMKAQSIELNAIRAQADVLDIIAKTLSLNPALMHLTHTLKTHSISAGVSLGVTTPLYVSASTFYSKRYQELWLPTELTAQNLFLEVEILNVIHSRISGVQGTLNYTALHLSEKQRRHSTRFYSGSASSVGRIHINLGNEDYKESLYHAGIKLLESVLAIQSVSLSKHGHKRAIFLDLLPIDLFHDLEGFLKTSSQQQEPSKSPKLKSKKVPRRSTRNHVPPSSMMHLAVLYEERLHAEDTEPKNHPDAIAKGVITGIAHLLEILKHPLDEFLYPLTLFTYDSIVCLTVSEAMDAEQVVPARPAAIARMEERWLGLKYTIVHFQKASPLKKTEQASVLLTTLVVPGQTLKLTSRLGRVASDLHRFRTVSPQKFQTRDWWDLAVVPPQITHITASELQTISRAKDFLYVVLPDGQLLLANERLTQAVLTRHGTKGKFLAHPELATFQPVVAAGKVEVKKGRILEVNDASGHFRPHGDHLPRLVERVFQRYNLPIQGKYQTRYGAPHPGLALTRVLEPKNPSLELGKELRSGIPFFILKSIKTNPDTIHSSHSIHRFFNRENEGTSTLTKEAIFRENKLQ